MEWNTRKWTLFSAKVVAYTTLCSGKGCLLVFLLFSVPSIMARLNTFMELAVFYLIVISYFYVAWIWPSKYLLFALEEVSRTLLISSSPENFYYSKKKLLANWSYLVTCHITLKWPKMKGHWMIL